MQDEVLQLNKRFVKDDVLRQAANITPGRDFVDVFICCHTGVSFRDLVLDGSFFQCL